MILVWREEDVGGGGSILKDVWGGGDLWGLGWRGGGGFEKTSIPCIV